MAKEFGLNYFVMMARNLTVLTKSDWEAGELEEGSYFLSSDFFRMEAMRMGERIHFGLLKNGKVILKGSTKANPSPAITAKEFVADYFSKFQKKAATEQDAARKPSEIFDSEREVIGCHQGNSYKFRRKSENRVWIELEVSSEVAERIADLLKE